MYNDIEKTPDALPSTEWEDPPPCRLTVHGRFSRPHEHSHEGQINTPSYLQQGLPKFMVCNPNHAG